MPAGLDPGVKAVIEQGRDGGRRTSRTSTAVAVGGGPAAAGDAEHGARHPGRDHADQHSRCCSWPASAGGVAITGAAADRASPLALNNPLGAADRPSQMRAERAGRARRLHHRRGARALGAYRHRRRSWRKSSRRPRTRPPSTAGQPLRRDAATTSAAATTTRSSRTRWGTRSACGTTSSAARRRCSIRPQYWQLRTKNGNVTTACTDASRTARPASARATGIR